MGRAHTKLQAPARVASRFEIVNALAWILARVDDLRPGARDPQHALEQALQDYEAILVRIEERASAGIYRAARRVWASIAHQDDARVLAWILERAGDLLDDGQDRHEAIERAIADCQRTWGRARMQRAAGTLRVARYAWAAASERDPRVGPGVLGVLVEALDEVLERALALHEGGCDPGDAIAHALSEHGVSPDLARVAFAAWRLALGVGGNEVSA